MLIKPMPPSLRTKKDYVKIEKAFGRCFGIRPNTGDNAAGMYPRKTDQTRTSGIGESENRTPRSEC